jgi:geranylgeranyl diphosphate synthase, type II
MYLNNVNNILTLFLITIKNKELRNMIDYSFDGGKRLRPMIIYELCNNSKINISNKIRDNLIIGIELLHSASLILDDMPNMDNDIHRRGKLCVYKMFGLQKSKLVANYMFLLSSKYFYLNTNTNNKNISISKFTNLVNIISKQNSNISKGQLYDLNITDSNIQFTAIEKINLKTYPLFVIAFLSPFIISTNEYNTKYNTIEDKILLLSKNFAYMFQINDDFEDIEKDMESNNINNHIKLLGLDGSIKLYNNCRNEFIETLKMLDVYTDFFILLLKKLDTKFIINGGKLL